MVFSAIEMSPEVRFDIMEVSDCPWQNSFNEEVQEECRLEGDMDLS